MALARSEARAVPLPQAAPEGPREFAFSEADFHNLAKVAYDYAGIALSESKKNLLYSRLSRRLRVLGLASFREYRDYLAVNEREIEMFINSISTNHTKFFREEHHFDHLRSHLVLPFVQAAKDSGNRRLRIWSAGCSSGEEPYSLAIALLEAGRAGRGDRIVATDVSERLLASARRGTYGPWSIRRLPKALADRYLAGSEVRSVAGEVRALVEFRRHNLVADPAPGAFDVVVCRNVLIYFEAPVAAEVLYRLVEALRPGGLLMVGPVELALASPLGLEWVDASSATLLRKPR
jgi:chemotaxis protein methyltransferase CheR